MITIPTLAVGPYRPPQPPPRKRSLTGCLVALIVVGALMVVCSGAFSALMMSVESQSRDAYWRWECDSNLQQIATALSLYESDYGSLPPAYTTNENGERLHSWRTLILPYLEDESLYESIDLDAPWDSEENALVHSLPLDIYQCPADSTGSPTDTSYVMIVGEGGLFDGQQPPATINITDGPGNTIVIVEVCGSGIHWMEPEDLPADEIDFRINGDQAIGICSEHEEGAHVLLADETVRFLPDDTDPADIRAAATPNGKEPFAGFPHTEDGDW